MICNVMAVAAALITVVRRHELQNVTALATALVAAVAAVHHGTIHGRSASPCRLGGENSSCAHATSDAMQATKH